jgi:ureidoglycolate lyase
VSADILARPLTAEAFAPFGDVLEARGTPDMVINAGMCGRFHDRARLDWGGGRAGVSVFDARPRRLPYALDLLERHPLGSQCFVPMQSDEWLVTVAPDAGGRPGRPLAFLAAPGQAVNLLRNVWHGVLTPLGPVGEGASGLFAVIDRIAPPGEAPGANLEEHRLDPPLSIARSE